MMADAQATPAVANALEVRDLIVRFPIKRGVLQRTVGHIGAVEGVDVVIPRGKVLGLVGESGSGKSTIAKAIMRLVRPTSGRIVLDGVETSEMSRGRMKPLYRRVQMVFQDPYSSLDPRMPVGQIVAEPLGIHRVGTRQTRTQKVAELLELVGLDPAMAQRRPSQFSGGQRQRIAIARALALGPDILVCDEPISALDVSVRAQVINLLGRLRTELGLTILFIAHDLAVVRQLADVVSVMYLGQIMESAPRDALYRQPLHPYTVALMSAAPIPDPVVERRRPRIILQGEIPSPADPPSGCRFRTRCPFAERRCAEEVPVLRDLGEGRLVACHFAETLGPRLGEWTSTAEVRRRPPLASAPGATHE